MSSFPNDADGDTLALLAAEGVDMSKPLGLEFAIAVPDEASAQAVEALLTERGYQVEVVFDEGELDDEDDEWEDDDSPEENRNESPVDEDDPLSEEWDDDAYGPSWTVYVNVIMVPTYDAVIKCQQDLDKLVAPLGGQVDGWGTTITGG